MNLIKFRLGVLLLKPFLENSNVEVSKDRNWFIKFYDKDKSLKITFCGLKEEK